MDHRIFRLFLLICSLFLLPLHAQASLFSQPANPQFVPVDQAFDFDFQQQGPNLKLNWKIRDGYYLYRDKIELVGDQAQLAAFILPKGLEHHDEFFGDTQVYEKQLNLSVPLRQASAQASLKVSYQGCAVAGFCYPPETRIIPLSEVSGQAADAATPTSTREKPIEAAPTPQATPLPFSPLWALLIGIGIAFTPCVLPMYPLISGIILGHQRPQSMKRIFLLALVYVQGMALTYTLLGMVVAAAGLQFQAALQSPWVLIVLSAAFILLALSMFGLFSLQLPSSVQTRLTLWSNDQKGGSLAGVFIMGALAGLICSPCTTAPLSAILLYIAQSGNLWAGAGTLYLYALGMGIPLIIVTLFGNRLLPRSGPWMQYVKEGFGFVILALPVFLLERIIGDVWGLRLWSMLGVAFFGWALIISLKSQRGLVRVLQLLLLAALLVGGRPLQDWAFPPQGGSAVQQHALAFHKINNVEELNAALQQAQGKRVMLDLYADWCVACKEFEKYTFTSPEVQNELKDTVLLQADVTQNNPQQVALLKRLQVLGLPTILFFGADGKELPQSRVTGFMNATQFVGHLQKTQP
ncbi:MAG: protein-disulfide reductase DsbD [Ewingella americana]|jgi:thiol:disulfide interchange protein DsbD|uniref:protein-disulfide reductase DsbD n=1 Tax=Ewingella americana TaxID=41202 RepID=UPI00242E7792|nr:protein-disulfide reductase DsbD [Ewingella americana]MCI1677800.1 protein-disulfide reductase DsbD [Ewingella americana]MCI1855688.1 protein-disulfide reductase DsbD [Ewingella americana]MCI1863174.1 protein-disulfide reductase DsbD [Ewingella americana]MCI2141352.1 protein-disulfide reductase DsbD [Ewingella americana]MCI2166324.1 protein-disulfide reductase DsbD [Ewingella americana]